MIHLPEHVLDRLAGMAREAIPKETGGILVGWLEGDSVSVVDVLQVPRPLPERNRYVLDAQQANKALESYLATADDKNLGYVGTWHTHPGLVPPSPRDLMTFRRIAKHLKIPLAFVVAATDGHRARFYPVWAGAHGRHPRLLRQPTITRTGS